MSRDWKNGSRSSYNCTPFLHSLRTKGKFRAHGVWGLGFIEISWPWDLRVWGLRVWGSSRFFVGLGFRVYGLGVFSCEVGWLMTGPSITALDLDQ